MKSPLNNKLIDEGDIKNKDKIKQLKTIVVLTVTFLISSKLTFVSSKYITFITFK